MLQAVAYGSCDSGGVGRATYIEKWQKMLKKEMTPAIFLLLCLDILMDTEADFIKEIRYLAGLMRQNCHDASWRMERLLSKVEQGESLDTRSTSIQLREAREELQQVMRGIERSRS
jgi:hypothetical protein